MMFTMEEFWNDNLGEGIMADIILGVGATSPEYDDKKRYKVNDKYGRNITDRNVKYCQKCGRLWELKINHQHKMILYVPKCNSIKIGKKEMVCQKCNK